MFVRRCLLTLLMAALCPNLGLRTCRFEAFGQNVTDTLVVTVTAAPGPGQELLKELLKTQNATLRVTDSRGTPLRGAMDDQPQGPAPLDPRLRPKQLVASPSAEPVEPGRRCPREAKKTPKPPPQNGTDASDGADGTDEVIATNKVEECSAQCSDAEGVEETVNLCDEGCDGNTNKPNAGAKDFNAVVEGGNEVAVEADADDKTPPPPPPCKACKKPADTAAPGQGDEDKVIDPCGAMSKDGTRAAGPCRRAEDENPPLVDETAAKVAAEATVEPDAATADPPAADPATGEEKTVEVHVDQEPQCRISLEEETQVNADCRSCSARVLPGGGVKLSCFQCEHRPADQTCYFARKMDPIFKVSARFFEMAELTSKRTNNTSALQVMKKMP